MDAAATTRQQKQRYDPSNIHSIVHFYAGIVYHILKYSPPSVPVLQSAAWIGFSISLQQADKESSKCWGLAAEKGRSKLLWFVEGWPEVWLIVKVG